MFISYYDESGDDGYPKYSSLLFVLSSIYLYYLNWKDVYSNIVEFRQQLKNDFGLPVKIEFHTKYFLLNKNPYKKYSISDGDRISIIDLFCDLVSQLELRIVNVVINKNAIKTPKYPVLDNALTYSIQRVENDLKRIDPAKKFMIITDEGRVGKMRSTSRKIQKINYIPSKYGNYSYRREIASLIEDPLPKNSKESYFIQLADMIAYIIFLYSITKLRLGKFPRRLPSQVNTKKYLIGWID